MCGIAGYVHPDTKARSLSQLLGLSRVMAHRGPDDEGLAIFAPDMGLSWRLGTKHTAADLQFNIVDGSAEYQHRIGLIHRRFSIFDTTSAGHQPFWSQDGQVCVVFNGEIYNHLALRAELEQLGCQFRTRSDTEVLVHAWGIWGERCFERFVGFFAIALYDARRRRVLLARDHVGKAPIYYTRQGNSLYFASEIRALREVLPQDWAINERALATYVADGRRDMYHRTMFRDISTFPSGSYAWVEDDGTFVPTQYWSVPERRRTTKDISFGDAAGQLREILRDSVALRMQADVPVGIELSGGLDSSTLLALAAQSTSGKRLRAYTIGFPQSSVDETPYARAVVDRYASQIDHVILTPPESQFFDDADEFVALQQEPIHAPNLRTHLWIWETMAKDGLRVSINGAAGDETLGGYADYYPGVLRSLLTQGRVGDFARELWGAEDRMGMDPVRFYATMTRRMFPTPVAIRNAINIGWNDPFIMPAGGPDPSAPIEISARMRGNMTDNLMNYWLRMGNNNYMSVPIEVRSPFLDRRLVDFAFTLPVEYLVRKGRLKFLLREAMRDSLPESVVDRKEKMGFPFPWVAWLRHNEAAFFRAAEGLDCPYINMHTLRQQYSTFTERNPVYLWRLMSVSLWWKRCIQGLPLHG